MKYFDLRVYRIFWFFNHIQDSSKNRLGFDNIEGQFYGLKELAPS